MDINLIENIIKNLNNKEKIDSKEELETLITDLHRIKNDIFDLNNKNEELNNRFVKKIYHFFEIFFQTNT